MILNEVVCNKYDAFVLASIMLAYLNEFHNYFKLYLSNTFLVIFILFNHSLKRWHSSVGLMVLSTCKWNYLNKYKDCTWGDARTGRPQCRLLRSALAERPYRGSHRGRTPLWPADRRLLLYCLLYDSAPTPPLYLFCNCVTHEYSFLCALPTIP